MFIKRTIFILLASCFSIGTFAQREGNIWYFGENAGLDFNSGAPVALTNSAMNAWDGCATLSDGNGNLLFYTDGISVWNRNHAQMPNGFGLAGYRAAPQSVIAVPKPGEKNKVYLFTIDTGGTAKGLSYSEIDMALNGGLGDVVTATKNTVLLGFAEEKITAVKHANGIDIWVIAHNYSGVRYYAYLISCSGISTPVTSDVGLRQQGDLGYLTTSPNGKRLAVALGSDASFSNNLGFEVLDFDNATGVVSNPLQLGKGGITGNIGPYGIAFSPNSDLLYGSNPASGYLYQWNLKAGTPYDIVTTVVQLSDTLRRTYALQLGPDGKIYATQYGQSFLSTINDPDVIGLGCNFQYNAVSLSGKICRAGLSALVQSYFMPPVLDTQESCFGAPVAFSAANNIDSVHWYFNDPASGALDSVSGFTATHTFTSPGIYNVAQVKYWKCATATTYITVIVHPLPIVDLGGDTLVCTGGPLMLRSLVHSGLSYAWSTGDTTATILAKTTGHYWQRVTEHGCSSSDTIKVVIVNNFSLHLPDTAICNTALPAVLHAPALPVPGAQYLWSSGATADSMEVSQAGTYWLRITLSGCVATDTIQVSVGAPPIVVLGADTTICENVPLQIGNNIAKAAYLWSTGAITSYINVSATGNYIVAVTLGPCTTMDTIAVIAMPTPVVNLGTDSSLCQKQSLVLDAGNTGIGFVWSNGVRTRTATITDAGKYWVQVASEYGCIGSDTIIFKPKPLPVIRLGHDTTICLSSQLILRPEYSAYDNSLLWNTGSTDRQIYVKEPGLYAAYASNECGVTGDTIKVRQIFCDIRLPNAFTPNGDGTNDILKVMGNIESISNFRLNIYNRWGSVVFTGNDKQAGWDGSYNGVNCPNGTYVYVLQYSIADEPVVWKGNVTLLR